MVVFQGAESYITPSWYPGKQSHGKVVPTWNYAVVHAYGIPRVVDGDAEWLVAYLGRLTETHEAPQALPWKLSDAPDDYIRQMVNGIVAIEIPIDKLVGKWKVSQNRAEADRLGVVAGLLEHGGRRQREMAELVGERLSGPKPKPKPNP